LAREASVASAGSSACWCRWEAAGGLLRRASSRRARVGSCPALVTAAALRAARPAAPLSLGEGKALPYSPWEGRSAGFFRKREMGRFVGCSSFVLFPPHEATPGWGLLGASEKQSNSREILPVFFQVHPSLITTEP